jgi:hypothetical protein
MHAYSDTGGPVNNLTSTVTSIHAHGTSSSKGGYGEAIGGIFSSLPSFLGIARRNNCDPPTAAGLKYEDTVTVVPRYCAKCMLTYSKHIKLGRSHPS